MVKAEQEARADQIANGELPKESDGDAEMTGPWEALSIKMESIDDPAEAFATHVKHFRLAKAFSKKGEAELVKVSFLLNDQDLQAPRAFLAREIQAFIDTMQG